jgi:hypothetical protein
VKALQEKGYGTIDVQSEIDRLTGEIQSIERQFSDSKVRLKELAIERQAKKNTDEEYLEIMDWRRRANYAKQSLLKELRELKDEKKATNNSEQSDRVKIQRNLYLSAHRLLLSHDTKAGTKAKKAALESLRVSVLNYEEFITC